jgi:hypothetical protein
MMEYSLEIAKALLAIKPMQMVPLVLQNKVQTLISQ